MGQIFLPKRYSGRDGEKLAESDIDWLFRIYDLGVPLGFTFPPKAYEEAVRGFLDEHHKVIRGRGKDRWLHVRSQSDSVLHVAGYDRVWTVFRKLHKAIDDDAQAYGEYTRLMTALMKIREEENIMADFNVDRNLEGRIETANGGQCGCMGGSED